MSYLVESSLKINFRGTFGPSVGGVSVGYLFRVLTEYMQFQTKTTEVEGPWTESHGQVLLRERRELLYMQRLVSPKVFVGISDSPWITTVEKDLSEIQVRLLGCLYTGYKVPQTFEPTLKEGTDFSPITVR